MYFVALVNFCKLDACIQHDDRVGGALVDTRIFGSLIRVIQRMRKKSTFLPDLVLKMAGTQAGMNFGRKVWFFHDHLQI